VRLAAVAMVVRRVRHLRQVARPKPNRGLFEFESDIDKRLDCEPTTVSDRGIVP